MMERWILHADMDAFYASIEQRDRPELRGKPVIVGASSPRGVVAAASYEARTFGVRSAMPGFRARQLCPEGVFLPGDMRKYAQVSREVHEIFLELTDQIEPLALDEAFLDITGSLGLFGTPLEVGRRLKARVFERTQLVVSVGLATNKLVAKTACTRGKPDGLLLVPPGQEAAFLAPLSTRALFGIGPKAAAQLGAAGFQTIGDIARAPLASLVAVQGRHAANLQARARGLDTRPVESHRAAKSIGEEATFPDNVSDAQRIASAIVAHASAVAARARRAGLSGRTVTLKIKLSRRKDSQTVTGNHDLFHQVTRQAALGEATRDDGEIRAVALRLWEALGLTEPIRLLGISLSELEKDGKSRQLSLFDPAVLAPSAARLQPAREDRKERLGRAIDAIADKFGWGIVRLAAEAPEKVTASDRHKLGESPHASAPFRSARKSRD